MRRQLLRSTAETAIRGVRGGRVRGVHKTIAFGTVGARSLMDRASDYGSEGWKFESSRARK